MHFSYITSTVVVLNEIAKLLACFAIIFYQKNGFAGLVDEINREIIQKPKETLLLIVPSGLYTLQTNLIYVSLSHVDATTFQITYQLKVLTTALFFVIILHKRLHAMQWLSLVLLTVGITLVQPQDKSPQKNPAGFEQNYWFGLICLIISAFSSGFAGVYFEKLLKNAKYIIYIYKIYFLIYINRTSLWIRNIQLSLFGVVFAVGNVIYSDSSKISENGFFYGYNIYVWMCVVLQAFGGLVVATVIKYSDNIMKAFATSLSIVVSVIVSILFMGYSLTLTIAIGTVLVMVAMFMYGNYTVQDVKPIITRPSDDDLKN